MKKIWIRDDLVEILRDETSRKKSAIPYIRKCVYAGRFRQGRTFQDDRTFVCVEQCFCVRLDSGKVGPLKMTEFRQSRAFEDNRSLAKRLYF